MYKRIVLAYDGSEAGQAALVDSRELAGRDGAELYVIAVVPPPLEFAGGEVGIYDSGQEDRERTEYQGILDQGISRLAEMGFMAQGKVVVGDAVDQIVRHAEAVKADLIVVGHHREKSWAARWWRGSVSKSLVEHSPCSVLVVIHRSPA